MGQKQTFRFFFRNANYIRIFYFQENRVSFLTKENNKNNNRCLRNKRGENKKKEIGLLAFLFDFLRNQTKRHSKPNLLKKKSKNVYLFVTVN